MGCNLRDLVSPESIELSDLSGQRIAIDVFLNSYQFITSMTGPDGKPLSFDGKPVAHLMGFLDRATVMISEGIDPVFVFDGKPHDLKRKTLDGRRERKIKAASRWEAAVDAGDMEAAKKLGPQTAEYTPDMVQETKDLFDLMGVSWVEAPMEAEGAAAVMCSRGDVAAVASQDWDTLLYGSPVMVRNLTSHGTRRFGRVMSAEKIVLSDTLQSHGITREQLVDLGIMVGTDFHPGIKGIGPKTGLKLMKKHGTMEAVAEAKGFELPEDLEGIRSLFMEHPVGDEPLPEAQRAVEEDLRSFLQVRRGFSDRRLNRAVNRLADAGRLRSSSQPSLFDF
ncbi:MAG TPA: flap structure-specific endonuclease [Candidatus Poseidoniales archaeon]|jgi:flap endonuclease-1|nr:MAG: flap structure-specific endonuclease [Euryarchaeota archaeon]HIG33929.1 flap structure-specific endonuclease [Candidatus Poseidoniales archaeon]HIL67593.1 flap structure-specific endonuclease [Candidatus Poseidoniales archaeon]